MPDRFHNPYNFIPFRDRGSIPQGSFASDYDPVPEEAKENHSRLWDDRFCCFVKFVESGVLEAPSVDNFRVDECYEIRVFNAKCELRWVRDVFDENSGIGVLLFDDGVMNNLPVDWDVPRTIENPYVREDLYLLWGKTTEATKKEWSNLFDHRIGSIFAPLNALLPGDRVALCFVEYAAQGDRYGNMSVMAERLCGMEC